MLKPASPFQFACPDCQGPLEEISPARLRCILNGNEYCQVAGIWQFLTPELETKYRQFIQDYQSVRQEEGRGSSASGYYRALPFHDLTGRFNRDWHIRARSFQKLVQNLIVPLEKRSAQAQKVLDLGAGNGWLSYQLARRGHSVAAVDLQINSLDGLGAWSHYDSAFIPVQADFDHLPFADGDVDMVIYNASFHYSTSYVTSLKEGMRVLKPGGQVVILDSPIYHRQTSGEQMVREREDQFRMAYGFPSNALASENYLTFDRIKELGKKLSIEWRFIKPFYGLRWALRPWKARLFARREPAQFGLVIGVSHEA